MNRRMGEKGEGRNRGWCSEGGREIMEEEGGKREVVAGEGGRRKERRKWW